MSRIRGIAPIHPPRTDDSYRWLYFLHCAYLHGRRVRTKHDIVGDVKRILGIARGMAGWNIQGLEVVIRALDFGTIFDRIAHSDENIFDFAANLSEWVPMSHSSAISRESDIQPLTLKRQVLFHAGKPRFQLLKCELDFPFDLIGSLAERRAFGGGDVAKILELCC